MDLFRVRHPSRQHGKMLTPWDTDLRAFYEFYRSNTGSVDGPAGLVIQDGRYAVCMFDRNGLRPSRWVTTKMAITRRFWNRYLGLSAWRRDC